MKIVSVFSAHAQNDDDMGRVRDRTISDALFTTIDGALRAAKCRDWYRQRAEPGIALQVEDGRIFPVSDLGNAPNTKVKKRPKPDVWIEGSTIVSVTVTEKAVHLWDGKGDPPKKDWHRPTVVVVGGRLYQLETDSPVQLDPE